MKTLKVQRNMDMTDNVPYEICQGTYLVQPEITQSNFATINM